LESHQTNAGFATTAWGMIVDARGDRHVLERLLRLYWAPVYAFIRRRGFSSHDASDLTQDFLVSVVLGRDLLSKADPKRGRFRSFLKQALRNYLIDRYRSGRLKAAIDQAVPLGEHGGSVAETAGPVRAVDGAEPTAHTAAEEIDGVFDRQWASTLVQIALERLEDSLRADQMSAHWLAFDTNVAGPALRATAPLPLDELSRRLRLPDAETASNMIQTVKRRFRRTLQDVVAETVSSPHEVDAELRDLLTLLGK